MGHQGIALDFHVCSPGCHHASFAARFAAGKRVLVPGDHTTAPVVPTPLRLGNPTASVRSSRGRGPRGEVERLHVPVLGEAHRWRWYQDARARDVPAGLGGPLSSLTAPRAVLIFSGVSLRTTTTTTTTRSGGGGLVRVQS
jgi:hypothetical protein